MESRNGQVTTEARSRRLQRLAARLASLRPLQVAIPAAIGISVIVVFGILQRTAYPTWKLANLDSEESVGTVFAATLLWAATTSWALVASLDRPRHLSTVGWAALLALLALDEGNAFHEGLERRSGIDWQVMYLPVLALGAFLWWRVVTRYGRSPTTNLLIAAAGAWGVTLVLELVQNWGGPPVRASIYDPTMITEEALEMVGSTLILLAGLVALRAGHSGTHTRD